MSSFVVEDGRFGSLETLHLKASDTGASAVVARRGATLLRWDAAIGDEPPESSTAVWTGTSTATSTRTSSAPRTACATA